MKAIQKTFTFNQLNEGTPEQVFPLLCPVREKDWLDGFIGVNIVKNSIKTKIFLGLQAILLLFFE